VVGLEAASWRWFGRAAGELSWAEAATLASLPNSPGLIHPGRNRETLKLKRDDLLARLFDKNLFDRETLRLALAEELPPEPLPLPQLAPHLLARLVRERGGAAAFKGAGGAAMSSTLDLYIQERAQAIMNRAAERFAGNGIMNGACIIINTLTGETAAYVGNVESPTGGDVDIIRAPRSSGSLLKPFLYAAMLDSGDILPKSLVSDIPTRVGSYSPENISRSYLGVVPADEALARSLNIPAVRNLRLYGVERFAALLRSLGLTTLFRKGEDYGLPLILGGAEVTLWEITGLYAGLARAAGARPEEAVFFPPRTDAPGSPPAPVVSPVSRGAAWLTLEALAFVTRPGEEAHWQEYAGARRIAWKTGTSFGFRDAWAVGTTPEWTVGVWIGNATGEGRAELRSAITSAPVLFELFSALEFSRSGAWFPQPAADLKEAEVCGVSGLPPGRDCQTIKTVLLPSAAPAHRPCPYCRLVISQGTEERRFVLPPAEEWYYRRWKADYRPLPSERGADFPMALFNPEEGTGIFVPRELDGSEGRVVFSAAHREDGALIHWHLDGQYLGSTSAFHEIEARPAPGLHTLTLVDRAGHTLTRRFRVLGEE
jgi:penicillin-binding protein 1C